MRLPRITPVALDLLKVELASPFSQMTVNCWLFRDAPDDWTLVDTGFPGESQAELWRHHILPAIGGRISRVICTHHHRDHAGQLGLLCRQQGAALHMSAVAWAKLQQPSQSQQSQAISRMTRYLASCGMDEPTIAAHEQQTKELDQLELPDHCNIVTPGQELRFGGRTWTATVMNGHAPGSLFLEEVDSGIVIVGDEILPVITPHIGEIGMSSTDDPLGDYLALLKWAEALPPGTLALPGHGLEFRDPGQRARALQSHHCSELERIETQVEWPATCAAVATVLFGSTRSNFHRVLAVTEAHAHLNRLVHSGKLASSTNESGKLIFDRA